MNRSANAALAKVRAMYGQMLTRTQYDDLIRRQSVQEISAYLREKTSYAAALSGVQDSAIHRGQLANLLHKDLFHQYIRLVRFLGPHHHMGFYVVMDMEINLILTCMRDLISGHPGTMVAEIPAFMSAYASFDLFALAQVRDFSQLLETVANTPYGTVLRQCAQADVRDGRVDYTAVEVALRTYYYTTLLGYCAKLHGESRRQVQELISLRAETSNLNTIFRLKTTFQAPPERIRKMLLPVRCRIGEKQLDRLVEARDAQTFMKMLCSISPYKRALSPEMNYIESGTEAIRCGLIRHKLHFSTDPQVVFLAFILLRQIEAENIIRVIEGVRYQLPPERIGSLLCH